MWLWGVSLIFSLVTFANEYCYGTCELKILSMIAGKKIYRQQEEVNEKNKHKFITFEKDEDSKNGDIVCNVYFNDNIKHICSPLFRKLYINSCRLPPRAKIEEAAFFGCVILDVWGPLNQNYARMVGAMRCEHIYRFHGYGKIKNILKEGLKWIHLEGETLIIENNTNFSSLEIEFDGKEKISSIALNNNRKEISFCGDLSNIREIHLPVIKNEQGNGYCDNVFISFRGYYAENCVNIFFPQETLNNDKQIRIFNIEKSLSRTGAKEIISSGINYYRCFDCVTTNELARKLLIGDLYSWNISETHANDIMKSWEKGSPILKLYIKKAILMKDYAQELSIADLIGIALHQNLQKMR